MNQTEYEIIEGIKKGDEKTYEKVFKTYYPVLCVFAKKYVHDLETGREIVQDLFVKMFENRNHLQITTSLKSYLFQSVKNRCFTYLSQLKNQEGHKEKIMIIQQEYSVDEVDYLQQAELEERVFHSINTLPDQCRRIFRMNRIEGKRNKEIAEDLDISIRTVETQISKALKILRENLEKYILIISVLISDFYFF